MAHLREGRCARESRVAGAMTMTPGWPVAGAEMTW